MNAAFLYHAIKAGLDMGIVNAGQLEVYEEIPKDLLERVEDVLLEPPPRRRRPPHRVRRDRQEGDKKDDGKALAWREAAVEERLKHALITGIARLHRRRRRGGPAEVPDGRSTSSKGR